MPVEICTNLVCTFATFKNYSRIKPKITKYFKES